jgi:hypothetical protein
MEAGWTTPTCLSASVHITLTLFIAPGSGTWKRIQQTGTKRSVRTFSSINWCVYQAKKQVQGYTPDMCMENFVKIRFY